MFEYVCIALVDIHGCRHTLPHIWEADFSRIVTCMFIAGENTDQATLVLYEGKKIWRWLLLKLIYLLWCEICNNGRHVIMAVKLARIDYIDLTWNPRKLSSEISLHWLFVCIVHINWARLLHNKDNIACRPSSIEDIDKHCLLQRIVGWQCLDIRQLTVEVLYRFAARQLHYGKLPVQEFLAVFHTSTFHLSIWRWSIETCSAVHPLALPLLHLMAAVWNYGGHHLKVAPLCVICSVVSHCDIARKRSLMHRVSEKDHVSSWLWK